MSASDLGLISRVSAVSLGLLRRVYATSQRGAAAVTSACGSFESVPRIPQPDRSDKRANGASRTEVIFEIVETEPAHDPRHLRTIFDYYRNAGLKVALDDVGSS